MSYGIEAFGVEAYGMEDVSIGGGYGTTVNCTLGTSSASGFDASVSSMPSVTHKIAFMGDSNGDGRLTNNQPFTGTGSYVYKHDGSVVATADPVGAGPYTYSVFDDGAGSGSLFPRIAQSYYNKGQSILAVPCCKGGTQASNWTRSTLTTTLYGAMKARIDAVGGVDKIVIFLGANDAIGGVSQSTFVSRINTLISDLHGDFPSAEIYLQKIHDFTGYGSNVQVIRAGVQQVWENNATVKRGADLDGITTSVHYTTDSDAITASLRTYAAIEGVTIVGATGVATANGFNAAVNNSAGVIINCAPGDATAYGNSANVSIGMNIAATPGAATAAGHTAAIELAQTINALLGNATAQGFDANLAGGLTVNCNMAIANAYGYTTQVSTAINVQAGIATAIGSGLSAAVLNQSSGATLSQTDIDAIVSSLVPAIIAALNATTIPVDVRKQNSVEIIGDGTQGNKFRSIYVG